MNVGCLRKASPSTRCSMLDKESYQLESHTAVKQNSIKPELIVISDVITKSGIVSRCAPRQWAEIGRFGKTRISKNFSLRCLARLNPTLQYIREL